MHSSKVLSRISGRFGFDDFATAHVLDPVLLRKIQRLNLGNFSREYLVYRFIENFVKNCENNRGKLQVAVVGGSLEEPELTMLKEFNFDFEISILGVEGYSNIVLDLNKEPSEVLQKFDLVLCSQVLEHVWDLENAFSNLGALLQKGGLLWISCPASNRFHGSPDFFSAGYSHQFLRNQLAKFSLSVLEAESFGSHRNYIATHSLDVWLTGRGHRWPMVFAFEAKPLVVRLILTLRFSLRIFYLCTLSSRVTANPRFATETWALARFEK